MAILPSGRLNAKHEKLKIYLFIDVFFFFFLNL